MTRRSPRCVVRPIDVDTNTKLAGLAATALLVGCAAKADPPPTSPPAQPTQACEPAPPPTATLAAPPPPTTVAAAPPPRPAEEEPIPFHCAGGELVVAGDRPVCVQAKETSFHESEAWCRSNGGGLTVPSSPEENAALQRALRSPVGLDGSAWIGLVEPREGDWRWSGGGRAEFTNWEPGEPNDAGGENCGELHAAGARWNDLDCAVAQPFLCERRGGAPFKKASCGAAFSAGDAHYCYDATPLAWGAAEAACAKRGARLAAFRSAADVDAFRAVATARLRADRAWVGVTDEGHEGSFTNARGKRASFAPWRPGEPNNAGGRENCVEWFSSDARWNDVPCELPRVGLCSPR